MGMLGVLLMLAWGGAGPAEAGPGSGAILKLWPTATVASNLVRLADVAGIYTDDAALGARLSAVELVPSPPPGGTIELDVRHVQQQLERLGFNLARVALTGASRVRVRTGGRPTPAVDPKPASRSTPAPPEPELSAEDLRRLVEDFLVAHLGRPREEIYLEMDAAAGARKLAGVGRGGLQIVNRPGMSCLGRGELLAVSYEDGRIQRQVSLPVLVGLQESVVVPMRLLPRGQTIQADDVAIKSVRVTDADGAFYKRVEDVVGKQTTRDLAAGEPISVQHLKGQALIRRNERVELTVISGRLRIRTEAVAKTDGVFGSLIEVCRLNSREALTARVAGPGQVVIEVPTQVRPVSVSGQPQPPPVAVAGQPAVRR